MGSLHRYRRTAIVALGLCLFSMTPARGAPVRGARRVPHLFTRVLTVRGMGDAATDTLYTFDGTHVTRQDFARGTLAQDGALAGGAHTASAPCAENVTCGRLTYRWTKCFQIADGYSYALPVLPRVRGQHHQQDAWPTGSGGGRARRTPTREQPAPR